MYKVQVHHQTQFPDTPMNNLACILTILWLRFLLYNNR